MASGSSQLSGAGKIASFKRSVSVRVEEKRDEPEAPVPCPTPTLQELEAVFEKEMASGSSQLSGAGKISTNVVVATAAGVILVLGLVSTLLFQMRKRA